MGQLLMQLPALSFILDDDTGEVLANLVPMEGGAALDAGMLREALIEAGYEDFRHDEKAIAEFAAASETVTDVLTMVVARRGDGKYMLTVADDWMSATLTLIPPEGGRPEGPKVLQELTERGITYGVLHDRLRDAITAGQCENLVIAVGDQPQPAVPTRFENLLADKQEVDELAVIDYADLAGMALVNAGDPLMRRHPAIPGKDGMNIKGEIVPVEPVEDVPFCDQLQGVAPHPDDPNLLVATVAGQPVPLPDGVNVNPVVQVTDVDLSTGNIDFDGTLQVKGDIKSGMRVKVGGDLIVNGMVEAAEITAGGSVTVRGGIVGSASAQVGGAHQVQAVVTKIRCKGSVQALFMEHVHVEAEDSIMVERSARQCELVAGNEITVGKQGSKLGQIIGGRVQATMKVSATFLGSSTGIKTLVQVGSNPFLAGQIAAGEKMLETKLGEMDRIMKLMAYFKKDPSKAAGGVGEKVEATRQQLAAEIERVKAEQKQLMEKNVEIDKACVSVSNTVHEGVEIRIGKHSWATRIDCGSGTARLFEDNIVFGRL